MKSATRKFFLTVLAALLAIVMTAGLVACTPEEEPKTEEKITYTVNVTAEDDVLTGVKVQVKSGETVKGESALTEGKAEFLLEKGTYTATLTDLPTGYTFTEATLTAESPSATIAVTKEGETPPPDDDTIAYTVTVTCVDDVLSGVKVQLLEDTTIVGEKDLVNGKAEFTLEKGTYTVSLTGLPAGYTFTEATVSPEEPKATVTVSGAPVAENFTYTVNLSYAAATDVYGTAHAAGPAAGVSVSLYASATDVKPAATVLTDETGKATFSLPGKSYTVSVASPSYKIQTGADLGLTDSASALTLTLEAKGVLGVEAAPIPFVLGKNEVPLSEEILTQYEDGVYYVFVPTTSGTYYFSTSNSSALLAYEGFPDGSIVGKVTELPIELEAGVPYVFRANSTGGNDEENLEFAYAVTISDKGTPEDTSDPNPNAPWEGTGVQEDPYVVENLIGDYSVVVAWRTNKFRNIYFTYTAKESGHYLASYVSGGCLVNFSNGKFIHEKNQGSLNDDSKTDFEVEAGATLTFRVESFDDDASKTFTAVFKIEEYTVPPAALGSLENPEELTSILGTHEAIVNPTRYYKFTETDGGFYTVTTTYSQGVYLTLRDGTAVQTVIARAAIPRGGSGSFTLEAGKTYVLGVSSNASGEPSGAETVNFTVEKADSSSQPDGTEARPYPLDKFFGDHSVTTDYANGVWYSYELEADMTVYVTAKTKMALTLGNLKDKQISVGEVETCDLKAGLIKMHVRYLQEGEGEVQFNIAKMGTADHPDTFSSLVGTHTVRTGYQRSASYFVNWKETEGTDYTITVKGVGKIYISGGSYNEKSLVNTNTAVEEVSADFTFEANKTYTFRFECYMVNEGDVVFTVAKKGEAPVPTTTYTVTVSATASDIFEQPLKGVPAADVAVSLYLGSDRVLTAHTDDKGVAKFEVAENSGYTVKVEGSDTAYTFTNKAVAVNVKSDVVYGTEAHPLTLQTGTTDIPFTYELLGKLHEADEDFLGAYYTFTPAKSGKYVFTVSEQWGSVLVIDGDETKLTVGGPSIFSEEGISGTVELEEGKTYTVIINSMNEGFTVTVGLEGSGDDTPADGTREHPYVIEEIVGEHTFHETSSGHYYTFTVKEAGTYTFTILKTMYLSGDGVTIYGVEGTTKGISLEAKAYIVKIMLYQSTAEGEQEVSFSVAKKVEEEPKPSESGTKDNPEVLTSFSGTYTRSADYTNGYYFSYTPAKNEYYTIANEYSGTLMLTVNGKQSNLAANGTLSVMMEAGKANILRIRAQSQTPVEVSFSVTALEVGSWEGSGTEADPYVITSLEGEFNVVVTTPVWFKFTATEDATFTFAPTTKIKITLTGDYIWAEGENAEYMVSNPASPAARLSNSFSMKAGETVVFKVGNYIGTSSNILSFTVTKSAAAVETALDGEYALPAEKH